MRIEEGLIESLLHESEGPTLDFKRDQYPFELADDDKKSELLKDLLAFANAFRRTDAFMLVGVEEVKGGRSQVKGVAKHLDDASLQQFVSSKTQRQVDFSYHARVHDGQAIGIFHIPIQKRPVYTKVNFGKVRRGNVYLRRGSSTDIATPDEIAQMGRDGPLDRENEPSLTLGLFDRETGKVIDEGAPATLRCVWIDLTDSEIPDYGNGSWLSTGHPYNRNYLRELTKYVQDRSFLLPVSLALVNAGSETALDVRLVIELNDPDSKYGFRGESDMPNQPERDQFYSSMSGIRSIHAPPQEIEAIKRGDLWRAECKFGKIQPRDTARLREDLFVGARTDGILTVPCRVYADNLSRPRSVSFDLHIQADTKEFSLAEIVQRFGR